MKTLLPALAIASAIAVTAARPQRQVSESEMSCFIVMLVRRLIANSSF